MFLWAASNTGDAKIFILFLPMIEIHCVLPPLFSNFGSHAVSDVLQILSKTVNFELINLLLFLHYTHIMGAMSVPAIFHYLIYPLSFLCYTNTLYLEMRQNIIFYWCLTNEDSKFYFAVFSIIKFFCHPRPGLFSFSLLKNCMITFRACFELQIGLQDHL